MSDRKLYQQKCNIPVCEQLDLVYSWFEEQPPGMKKLLEHQAWCLRLYTMECGYQMTFEGALTVLHKIGCWMKGKEQYERR